MLIQKSPLSFCFLFCFSSVCQDICLRSYSDSEVGAFSSEENFLSVPVTYDSSWGGWWHLSPWRLLCFVFLLCLEEVDVIFEDRQCHGRAVSEQPHIIWEPTAGCCICREENWNPWEWIPEPDWDILRLLYQRSHWCWSKHAEDRRWSAKTFKYPVSTLTKTYLIFISIEECSAFTHFSQLCCVFCSV